MTRFVSSALLTLSVVACGGNSLPPAKAADTQASISAAAAVGADQNPQAALHLKMARDQLKQAQDLIANDKGDQAKLVLERANADAEVALMITREAEASAAVKKTQADTAALKNGDR
jgi:Domain of unknown function (DUF4398)